MSTPKRPSGLPSKPVFPPRISNAHSEKLLDELSRARLDEQRRLAKQLYNGVAQEVMALATRMRGLHADLAQEGHPLIAEAEQVLCSAEKALSDLQVLVNSLDANLPALEESVSPEGKRVVHQMPHGHRYEPVERVAEESETSRRLFAL